MPRTITFTSDFGQAGGYVAACEAVIARLAPGARLLHVDHLVPPGDVGFAARVLARVAPLGPTSVHLVVVDPGVGTERRPIALHAGRGDYFVGPDNGVLIASAEALGGIRVAWRLDPVRVREQAGLEEAAPLSRTFHGRDLFAPAAALLAQDLPGGLLGDTLDPVCLVPGPEDRVERQDGRVTAEISEIDRFGNVALALPFAELRRLFGDSTEMEVRPAGGLARPSTARVVGTFGDLRDDELGLVGDSWGAVALVMNGRRADRRLGVTRGELVALSPGPLSSRGIRLAGQEDA